MRRGSDGDMYLPNANGLILFYCFSDDFVPNGYARIKGQ